MSEKLGSSPISLRPFCNSFFELSPNLQYDRIVSEKIQKVEETVKIKNVTIPGHNFMCKKIGAYPLMQGAF